MRSPPIFNMGGNTSWGRGEKWKGKQLLWVRFWPQAQVRAVVRGAAATSPHTHIPAPAALAHLCLTPAASAPHHLPSVVVPAAVPRSSCHLFNYRLEEAAGRGVKAVGGRQGDRGWNQGAETAGAQALWAGKGSRGCRYEGGGGEGGDDRSRLLPLLLPASLLLLSFLWLGNPPIIIFCTGKIITFIHFLRIETDCWGVILNSRLSWILVNGILYEGIPSLSTDIQSLLTVIVKLNTQESTAISVGSIYIYI